MTSRKRIKSGCPTWTGDAVVFFNFYLTRQSPRAISNLFELIWKVPTRKCPEEVRRFLGKKQSDLYDFLSEQTQFFEVIGGSVSMRPKKTKEEIESLLKASVQRLSSEFSEESSSSPSRINEQNTEGNIRIVKSPGECSDIVRRIMSQPSAVVAIDCEGENIGKYGKLDLIQMATCDGRVYLFDVLATANKHKMFRQGRLADLLESDEVVKVMHNCRGDSCVLYHELGVTLRNVFDTESVYGTLMLQHNIDKRQSGPGLNHICELFGGRRNELKESKSFKRRMIFSPNFWKTRPLTTEMINYAAKDVSALVPTVYENMKRLVSTGWSSFMERQCQESVNSHFNWKA
ncbi:egalitarian protein homolog [Ptychodera flava]|uniref:egalitarian protein homolog n=1 Tax=Ptychodera flava TaxID=63121 RepID=UPI003969F165